MEVVKETAPWQELSDHVVLVVINAHAHVKHDWWVQELVDDLDLFDKVAYMLVPEAFLLDVFFNCDLLPQPLTQVDLSITALADGFNNLDLLFGDQEV